MQQNKTIVGLTGMTRKSLFSLLKMQLRGEARKKKIINLILATLEQNIQTNKTLNNDHKKGKVCFKNIILRNKELIIGTN
jgi:hypothetical protein